MKTIDLAKNRTFKKEAKKFAHWWKLKRKAQHELGKLAHRWCNHYSRTHNSSTLAQALFEVTGLEISPRTIREYRDVYALDSIWRSNSGATHHNRHVDYMHLRVVSRSSVLPEADKLWVLNLAEKKKLSVKQTERELCIRENKHNRKKFAFRIDAQRDGPIVYQANCLDLIQDCKNKSIGTELLDFMWGGGHHKFNANKYAAFMSEDPVGELCQLIELSKAKLHKQGIMWIWGRASGYDRNKIGIPHEVSETLTDCKFVYAGELVCEYGHSCFRKGSFFSLRHQSVFAFVGPGFNFKPQKNMSSVKTYRNTDKEHPFEKSVEVFVDLIECSPKNSLCFDCFAGSGNSGIACCRTGNPYLAAEMYAPHVKRANQRIAQEIARLKRKRKSA